MSSTVRAGLPGSGDGGTPDGAAFHGASTTNRRGPAGVAIAAVVLVAVAVLGRQLGIETAPASASATPVSATPAPSSAQVLAPSDVPRFVPVRSQPTGPPDRDPTATPYPTDLAEPVPAGRTELVPAGSTGVRVTITLPAGWQRIDESLLVKPSPNGPVGLSISAWSLRHVNVYPCRWSGDTFADEGLMGFARGQAQALSSWWGQDPLMPPNSNAPIAPIATKPEAMTFRGYPAWSLEVLVPSRLDLAGCDAGQFVLWDAATGQARMSVPGELNRLWVVDVDNIPIVLDAGAPLDASAGERAELQAIVDSIPAEP